MAQQNINVGTVPNDGTGDTLRDAMIKTQNNFSEFYSSLAPNKASNNVTVANNLILGANVVVNGSTIFLGNTSVNTAITGGRITFGTTFSANSSVVNAPAMVINSVSANLVVGNTSTYTIVNNQGIFCSTNAVSIGTSNIAGHTASLANGYIHMPNGLTYMWGTLATANSTANIVTFTAAVGTTFLVNAYTVSVTSNNNVTSVAVPAVNSTSITLQTNNATAQLVYWSVMGL